MKYLGHFLVSVLIGAEIGAATYLLSGNTMASVLIGLAVQGTIYTLGWFHLREKE